MGPSCGPDETGRVAREGLNCSTQGSTLRNTLRNTFMILALHYIMSYPSISYCLELFLLWSVYPHCRDDDDRIIIIILTAVSIFIMIEFCDIQCAQGVQFNVMLTSNKKELYSAAGQLRRSITIMVL